MQAQLDGKTALVTEASLDLGRAIAIALGAAGANVVVHAPSGDSATPALAEDIRRAGGSATVAFGDMSRPDDVEKVAREAEAAFGRVDILINHTMLRSRHAFLSLLPQDWDRILRAHLHAAFYCAQRLLPAMMEAGRGRIINISSIEVFAPARQRTHLMTCKAGLIGLTRALAQEFGPAGITANAVVPGHFDTETSQRLPEKALKTLIPAGRIGNPAELGQLCVFLASEAGAYINGQTIHSNGGRVMV